MMVDEKRKVSLLRGKLQEKHEELHHTHRQLREASDSVTDFEKMIEGLYTRLEAKEVRFPPSRTAAPRCHKCRARSNNFLTG